jgi:hypothetical protein
MLNPIITDASVDLIAMLRACVRAAVAYTRENFTATPCCVVLVTDNWNCWLVYMTPASVLQVIVFRVVFSACAFWQPYIYIYIYIYIICWKAQPGRGTLLVVYGLVGACPTMTHSGILVVSHQVCVPGIPS